MEQLDERFYHLSIPTAQIGEYKLPISDAVPTGLFLPPLLASELFFKPFLLSFFFTFFLKTC
jgi:hypothetical protein